ncbi:hypothetical protein TTHERM_01260770 (macronuclear) [Tetrahymena thermophila SB210]|uniref:Uncharacterized protein n=1 Tax=Tetrahymena thermophila (strain SB210) TaxID=312017 RepID=Q22A97_TETTS|nr:hypothetical protein TTHERM_01260770 [Tetrahymena thermophila SB210]EAR82222.3 hypothetical protein TTHERM_01260770 [Tetrahymena thermophila SB210]|eukprot:XP_001029885.3 hypothetical protein TTHERM_01260770 [Tetrahymena thermophila SB210]
MDKNQNIEEQNDDMQQLRARFYSSMNYNEYVNTFDKPPQKPAFKPVKMTLEEQINEINLDDLKTDDSLKLPEVRKPSQSVNFMIGKYSSSYLTQSNNTNQVKEEPNSQNSTTIATQQAEQIEEIEEEDQFESEFSISNNKMDQGYKNRNRSQSENSYSIFNFLERTRKQSLAN